MCDFLDRAVDRTGKRPKHIITDHGGQFISDEYRTWCKDNGIRPRWGAVGKQGSIAIVERMIRSVKWECTRRIRVPFGLDAMRQELALYATWYNTYRPHQTLGGMMPEEVYEGRPRCASAFELRPRWPVEEEAERVKLIHLVVKFLEGRRHLPIVELKRAA